MLLSFPGISADIERWTEVEVTYQDETGNAHRLEAKGLLARAIQHELDHLNGEALYGSNVSSEESFVGRTFK